MQSPSWSYPIVRWRKLQRKQIVFTSTIARGGGRSYGDSNFKYGSNSTNVAPNQMQIDFGRKVLRVSGGTRIIDALNYLGAHGFELFVVPGTAYATIGGCIASDIHGKNSHKHGSFSRHLKSMTLIINDQEIQITSKDTKLWKSTIGGCGLTGIIIDCEISIKPIKSGHLESRVIVVNGLNEMLKNLKTESKNYDYAIGWLDGRYQTNKGKGFIHYANEAEESSPFQVLKESQNLINGKYSFGRFINSPLIALYNVFTMKKYQRKSRMKNQIVSKREYFFPLIDLGFWNKLFGRKGFHEVQFFSPFGSEKEAEEVLNLIIKNQPVFLIGVKIISENNVGIIGFPGKGWSIAVDFRANRTSEDFVKKCHEAISRCEGSRIYLTKDWVLEKKHFDIMYPDADYFRAIRYEYDMKRLYSSEMSERLAI